MTYAKKWLPCIIFLSASFSLPAQQPGETPAVAQTRAEIQGLEALLPKVPDRAAVLYFLAIDYAQIGNLQKAFALLRECVAANEGFNPDKEPLLRPLYDNPGFRALVTQAGKQYPPVSKAQEAFTVPEKDLFPEGLAVDAEKQVFYLSSLFRRKVVRIGTQGQVSDFVQQGKDNLLPLCGLTVDGADHSLWAAGCQNNGHGELYHFAADGNLLERFPPPTPGPHLFNDLVLRGASGIYLTDSLAGQTYYFDRKTHAFTALSFPRPLFYPNGIALSGDQKLLYVADAFGVLQYDLKRNTAQEVDRGASCTLSGIDGLYWYRGELIGVQNGIGLPRITQFSLSPDGLHVRQARILEYRSSQLTTPTTGAVKGTNFYFIANTQNDNFKDEKIVKPEKLEPVRIDVVGLMPIE